MFAWIRFFEAVVHLGYLLEKEKWRTVTEEDKSQDKRPEKRHLPVYPLTVHV